MGNSRNNDEFSATNNTRKGGGMANPALSNNSAFQSNGYATFNTAPQAPQFGAPGATPTADQLEGMYSANSANTAQMGRMTYDDVIMKTTICFGVLLAGAAVTWNLYGTGLGMILMWGGLIGGLILGIVNSFKKNPSPALILAYAGLEGFFVGGFSKMIETITMATGATSNPIVVQAVVATLCVFGAMLLGYKSGKFRTSPKLNKMFMIAAGGYALFSIVNLVLMLTGVVDGTFGLRSGPMGIAIGLLAVALASYALIMDFEMIENGVRNGAPARMAWAGAFGLMVTIIWLYIEILRILAILRGSD